MVISHDERLKIPTFTTKEKLLPIIDSMMEEYEETNKNESIEIKLYIKGYDNRKDPKTTKELVFPSVIRRNISLCVIGDDSIKPEAERLGLTFFNTSEYEGKTKEKERKKIVQRYKNFILSAGYQKSFNLREILKRKKTHFLCPTADKLEPTYKGILNTCKLKVRDWNTLNFPAGHCELSQDEIVDNIKYGVGQVAKILKKGAQNIRNCFVKRTTGKCFKLY